MSPHAVLASSAAGHSLPNPARSRARRSPPVRRSRAAPSVRHASTKAGKSRRLPLVARAAEIVQAHAAGKGRDEPIYRSARGKNPSAPNFTRALDWAGIAHGRRIHDLRHTAATNWLLAGVDIKTVSAWLGHADSAITLRIYTHYVPSHNDAAAVSRLNYAAAAAKSAESATPAVRNIG